MSRELQKLAKDLKPFMARWIEGGAGGSAGAAGGAPSPHELEGVHHTGTLNFNTIDEINISAAADGQVLYYDSTAAKWQNTSLLSVFPATNTVEVNRASAGAAIFNIKSQESADGDAVGTIHFYGKDSGSAEEEYARVSGGIQSNIAGSEMGFLDFLVSVNGAFPARAVRIRGGGSEQSRLYQYSTISANGQYTTVQRFFGHNSIGDEHVYAMHTVQIITNTDGSEDGSWQLSVATGGILPGITGAERIIADHQKVRLAPIVEIMAQQASTPATPDAGFGRLYGKSADDHLYWLTDGGVEFDLTTAAGLDALYLRRDSSNTMDGNLDFSGSYSITAAGDLTISASGGDAIFSNTRVTFNLSAEVWAVTDDLTLHLGTGRLVAEYTSTTFDTVFELGSERKTAGNEVSRIEFRGHDSGDAEQTYAQIAVEIVTATGGSEDGRLEVSTWVGGAATLRMGIDEIGIKVYDDFQVIDGLQIGSPTGGDKGTGTINAAADIYKNDSAYTNPDYVLEHHYRGSIFEFADSPGASEYFGLKPLNVTAEFMELNLHLPWIQRDKPSGIFDRGDMLLVGQETLMLYVIQLENRIAELEGRNDN